MGGMVIQKYLESHRLPAAVLMASAPPKGLLASTLRIARKHPLIFLKVNLTRSLYPAVGTPDMCKEVLFSANMPGQQVDAYFARLQDESYRAYMDMVFFNLPRSKRVDTPMLVLGAVNDKAISVYEVEATARAYGVQAEIFPDMAHNMMLEAGWQTVADRILTWLEEHGL
jgi:pimeloyl-ACP methyl ester carboxylesterase